MLTVFIYPFVSDGLVKKLEELEKVADMYRALIAHTGSLLKAFYELSQSHKGKWNMFDYILVHITTI